MLPKDPVILERAYWNTVKMLDNIVEVETLPKRMKND